MVTPKVCFCGSESSKPMLFVTKDVIFVDMVHDGTVDDVIKKLEGDGC